jgi:hypothetical protein
MLRIFRGMSCDYYVPGSYIVRNYVEYLTTDFCSYQFIDSDKVCVEMKVRKKNKLYKFLPNLLHFFF